MLYTLNKTKFPKHHAAVEAALNEARAGVHESPDGSNTGLKIIAYQRATFLGGTGWAWCAAFFNWAWKTAGKPLPYRSAGAYDLYGWAQRNGWTTNSPMPGDGVCWNVGSGHFSMFLARKGDMIITVDGNVSNRVQVCSRPASLLRGFMHIPETGVILKKKVPPPKKYQIVTSASGHTQLVISARTLPKLMKYIPSVAAKHPKFSIVLVPSKKGKK